MKLRLSLPLLLAVMLLVVACRKDKNREPGVGSQDSTDFSYTGKFTNDKFSFQMHGAANTVYWDFGDGNARAASGKNVYNVVTNQYLREGTYTVSLVIDGNNAKAIKKDITVEKYIAPPSTESYAFSVSGVPVVGDTICFKFTGYVPAGNTYLWTFGDGSSSIDSFPPPHIYLTPGSKTVRVVVNGDYGKWNYTYFDILPDPLYTTDIAKVHAWYNGKDPGLKFVNKLTLYIDGVYDFKYFEQYSTPNELIFLRPYNDTLYYNRAKDSISVHLIRWSGGAGIPATVTHTYYHTI